MNDGLWVNDNFDFFWGEAEKIVGFDDFKSFVGKGGGVD